mgnify:CR=1 FL=1
MNIPTATQRSQITSGSSGYGDIRAKAKNILSSATLGSSYPGPYGWSNIPILHNGVVVGWLWENVPLKDLEIGDSWPTGGGVRVSLIYKGRIVGFLWV